MAPLVFVRTAVEEQERDFRQGPMVLWATPANRKNLETVQRYTHQQGMIRKITPLEELFADTDLGDVGSAAAPEEF